MTHPTKFAALAAVLTSSVSLAQTAEPVVEPSALAYLLPVLLPALMTGIFLVAGWALAALAKKLNADAGTSKAKGAIWRAVVVAEAVVADVDATTKPLIARASADGKITPAEAKEIKDVAVKRVLAVLGDKGVKELQAVLEDSAGGIGVFIGGLIEKALVQLKAGKALSKPTVTNIVTTPQALTAGGIGAQAALAGVGALPSMPQGAR